MKQIILNESEFKTILDGANHTVSFDDARPALQHIKLVIEQHSITAYSLDGYRASRVVIKRKEEIADNFVCYIKPVPFKDSKSGARTVTISHDGILTTTLQYQTPYGEMTCRFNVNGDEFPNIENIFAEAEEHDRRTAVNAKYVADAMKALAKTTTDQKNYTCVIESKPNVLQPLLFKVKDYRIENTQLVLPVRIFEREEQ